jgi:isoleucyl-tRNA synthetase
MAQVEGYVSDGDNKVTVVLDTKLTPQLIEEGFVREITSKIQTMRKEAGFEVTDKITVYIKDNEKIAELVLKNSQSIKSDVLAREIIEGSSDGYEKQWNINGEDVVIAVKKN